MLFGNDALITYFCTIYNTVDTIFKDWTRINSEGVVRIDFPNGKVELKVLKDGSLKGYWFINGTSIKGNAILKPS